MHHFYFIIIHILLFLLLQSFFRGISVGDMEGIAVIKLARLHEHLEEEDDASKYYLHYIEQAETIGVSCNTVMLPLLFHITYVTH